jgi:hypothetical protein
VAQETSTPPTAAIITEAKSDVGALVGTQVLRIRQEMVALAKRLQSGPLLTQEVQRWANDLQNQALIEGNREIDIWAEIEARKKPLESVVVASGPAVAVGTAVPSNGRSPWKILSRFFSWVHDIGKGVIGSLIAAAIVGGGGFAMLKHLIPAKPVEMQNLTSARKSAVSSYVRPPMIAKHNFPPPPSTSAANVDAAAQAKALEIAHLQTVQHIDRAIEDGKTGLADAQKLFQQKFNEGSGAAARRGLSGSSVEQSYFYIAMQTGQAKVDDVDKKTKRAIEDELVQYGMTIPDMNRAPWLQSEKSGYSEFKKQVESAKDGMAATIKSQDRQRRTHL